MNARLILSVFPGIDLLGTAFEPEGFCVVRGPDLLWGGDIRRFSRPAGHFCGVIGGPPGPGQHEELHRMPDGSQSKRRIGGWRARWGLPRSTSWHGLPPRRERSSVGES